MRVNERRVEDLERRAGISDPSGWGRGACHTIAVDEGQSEAEAIDAYGRDRVRPDDNIIFLVGEPIPASHPARRADGATLQ